MEIPENCAKLRQSTNPKISYYCKLFNFFNMHYVHNDDRAHYPGNKIKWSKLYRLTIFFCIFGFILVFISLLADSIHMIVPMIIIIVVYCSAVLKIYYNRSVREMREKQLQILDTKLYISISCIPNNVFAIIPFQNLFQNAFVSLNCAHRVHQKALWRFFRCDKH